MRGILLSTSRARPIKPLVIAGLFAVAATAALAGSSGVPSAPAHDKIEKGGHEPRVVCITAYQPPRGAYRFRPRQCELHHRGAFPIAGYATQRLFKLKWRSWGPRRARGRGMIGISTVGPVPVKVTLARPKHQGPRCNDRAVFSKARLEYKGRSFDGTPIKNDFSMRLTTCLV